MRSPRLIARLARWTFVSALIALPLFAHAAPATQEATPDPIPSPAPRTSGMIDDGKPVTVDLTGEGAVELRYSADDAVTISVQARSVEVGAIDVILEVTDASGTRLAFNDDHGTPRVDLAPLDSAINGLQLPARGDYLIRINSFSGAAIGQVEVALSLGGEPPPLGGRDDVQTITGSVPDNDRYTYGVELVTDDVVTITVRATDNTLDPKVALVAPDGSAVATNDDHGTQEAGLSRYDSRIGNFVVTETGFYTIEITGFGGIGGEFELIIALGGDANAGVGAGGDPGRTVTVDGSVIEGVPFQYYIDAAAGEVITISARATSDNLDVDVALYTLEEEFLESNYEHGSSDPTMFFYDARITNFIVQTSGTYLIEVVGYEVESQRRIGGDLELTIERVASGAPLGAGDEEIFLGEIAPNGTASQTFEAEAGTYVTIAVRALTRGLDTTIDLITPSGVLAESNDDHGQSEATMGRLDSQITRYPISESGEYVIEVGGYRDTAGSFAITVTTYR
jgi:hypothetical protein